jgi:hypothetical protein
VRRTIARIARAGESRIVPSDLNLRARLAALATCALAACSSGGSSAPAASPPPPPAVAPQITSAPTSRAAAVGASVSFSVSAIGGSLAYQWRRNGVDIAGATGSSFALAVALADDGARFSVVVSNGAGQATSSEALLNVHPVPPLVAACQGAGERAFTMAPAAAVEAGNVAGAAIGGCQGPLRSVTWTQTAGPPVPLLSARTGAISFLVPAAGSYTFRADAVDSSGMPLAQDVTISAMAAGPTTRVGIRGDHAVRRGGNVSLRAWPELVAGDAVQSVTWRQTFGPAVVLDTGDPLRAMFVAPPANPDVVLGFEATLRTVQGRVAADEAYVLVESAAPAPDTGEFVFGGTHVSRVVPYRPSGPYAAHLQRCVYDPQLQWQPTGTRNTCTLATLPFLAQDTAGAEPTVAQIMDRVLVSHDWMGDVFEQFIARADMTDVRRLLNGVTAIVIGAQVRPSFYYGLTGAIYLDADNFWLTPEQRDVINEAPDFRSDFDRDLQYSGLWRYTLNSNNVFLFFPPTSRTSRSLDYLVFEAGWLMYHELAHAGDFLPPAERGALNPAATVWDNIGPRYSAAQLPSDLLTAQLPLTSAVMRGLAQVKFRGVAADPAQMALTPQQVGDLFAADRATDEYNYSSTREDIAMLFEEFMMYQRHGARRDVAIADKITPATTGNTLIVRWGQRGRAAAAAVRPRVRLAVQNIAPWIDANLVDALPAPLAMRAGESWNANLVLPAAPGMVQPQSLDSPASRAADVWLLQRATRRDPLR